MSSFILVAEKGEPDINLNTVPIGSDYTGPLSTIAYVYFPDLDSDKLESISMCQSLLVYKI
jgi:hypothetical protein